MKYALYGLFRDESAAKAAVQEVREAGVPEDACQLILHRGGVDPNDLHHAETDSKRGLYLGLVLGVVLGAITGWLLAGPFEILPVGQLAAAAMGAVIGVIPATIGAVLYGAGLVNPKLRSLAGAARGDQVLLTAEIEDLTARDIVASAFRHHGAVTQPA